MNASLTEQFVIFSFEIIQDGIAIFRNQPDQKAWLGSQEAISIFLSTQRYTAPLHKISDCTDTYRKTLISKAQTIL